MAIRQIQTMFFCKFDSKFFIPCIKINQVTLVIEFYT